MREKSVAKNRLKELRMEKRLTVRQLAEKTNISHSMISYFENYKSELTVERVVTLCNFFRVSLDYMFYRSNIRLMAHQLPQYEFKSATQKTIYLSLLRISDESTLKVIKGVIDSLSDFNSKVDETSVIDTHNKTEGIGKGTIFIK